MTVSKSIITWLKTFGMNSISTDIQPSKIASYSLAKEPTENIKRYLSGKKEVTSYYQIMARLPNLTENMRDCNVDWGEKLTSWVETQNKNENFPVLDDASVKYVGVSTPMVVGTTQNGESIYQMTITIKYTKEN